MKWAACALIAAMALMACGVTSGTVTGKHYDSPYDYWTSQCMSYGKNGNCTFSMPVDQHVPAHYYLSLRASNGDTGDVEVPASDYDRYRIGDQYP